MISDFRFALRRIWNTPGPTAIVLGTLSLTIAAATVVYSTIDIIYHLMPIANRDRMVFIASVDARRNESMRLGVSAADLVEVTRQATTLEAVGAFTFDSATLTGMVVPVRVSTLRVTPNLPALWGLLAAEGRLVQVEDGRPGAEKVAVLTHAFWQREFGTDPAVVGRTVRVNDEPHTRAGCVPCASRIWNNPARCCRSPGRRDSRWRAARDTAPRSSRKRQLRT